MPTKTINDPELGEIKLSKYKAAKYIKVKVDEDGHISMSMPYYTRYDEALDYAYEKRDWIQEQQTKFRIKKTQLRLLNPKDDFSTKFRKLELIPCALSKASYRISPTLIKVYYPEELKPEDAEVEAVIKEAIEKTLRREAHNYLPRRLQELASKHGLKYNRLSIRNTRSRWGSCSHDNNINLCIHLLKLPDKLIDYVILHELAHTVEKNHSAKFWSLLSDMLGTNARAIDKKLKAYRPDVDLG